MKYFSFFIMLLLSGSAFAQKAIVSSDKCNCLGVHDPKCDCPFLALQLINDSSQSKIENSFEISKSSAKTLYNKGRGTITDTNDIKKLGIKKKDYENIANYFREDKIGPL